MITGYLDAKKLKTLADILSGGGVAVLPTDTMYGFHCDALSAGAVERIISMKGGRKASGFIILVSSIDMAGPLVSAWPDKSRAVLERLWPAPLTAILPSSEILSGKVAPAGKVAIRMPSDSGLLRIVSAAGAPLVSTSVNRTGRPPMTRISDIMRAFPEADAFISQKGRSSRKPSTIIDMTSFPWKAVRKGAYPLNHIPGALE